MAWSEIEVAEVQGKSRLITSKNIQPLKILNPQSHSAACHVVLSSYGGGIVSGDQISVRLGCHENAKVFLTTQANTKIFRSVADADCGQILEANIAKNALVVSFPDPVVPQENSRYRQSQHWQVEDDAILLLADWLHSGRMDIGEKFLFDSYYSEVRITKNDKPLLLDRFFFDPKENFASSLANFGPFQTVLSIYLVGPESTPKFLSLVDRLREIYAQYSPDVKDTKIISSLSKVKEGLYVFRAMGKERMDFERLCSQLMEKLEDPELLGFNPLRRKY